MKKIIAIILFAFCANLSAQTNTLNWLTDYKEALKTSEKHNNPVLVFVEDDSNAKSYEVLKDQVFNSKAFKSYTSSFILLNLNTTTNSYNKRLAKHYAKSDAVPALVLVDENGNTIGKALTEFSSESISEFMSFLKTKTKH